MMQMQMYQHANCCIINMQHSYIYSEDIADLKILQSNWLRAFWPTPQEPPFLLNKEFQQEPSKKCKLSLYNNFKKI